MFEKGVGCECCDDVSKAGRYAICNMGGYVLDLSCMVSAVVSGYRAYCVLSYTSASVGWLNMAFSCPLL